jgi:hypothetical protein
LVYSDAGDTVSPGCPLDQLFAKRIRALRATAMQYTTGS